VSCKGAIFIALAAIFLTATAQAQQANESASNAKKKAEQPEIPSGWAFVWKDHPSVRFGDVVRLDLRARVAAELVGSEIPFKVSSPDLDLARRRVGIDGRVLNLVDFQIERELGGVDPWRDVYANVRRFRSLELQAGQFKLPFSLDETTGASNLDFVYRSRVATTLAPGRDTGAMLHGQLFSRRLSYEAGLFAHDGDNSRSHAHPDRVAGNRTTAVRLGVQPLRTTRSPWRSLTIGAAMTVSRVPDGIMAVHGQTPLDQTFFPADFWVNGRRQRTGVEVSWNAELTSVESEYIRFSNERRGEGIRGEDLPLFVASGWYVSGTRTLMISRAGEPGHLSFIPHRINRLDAAARIERLTFGNTDAGGSASFSPRGENVRRNSDTILTLGINWYVSRWLSLRANLIHDSILDADLAPSPSRPSYWSRAIRFEFVL
jgi:hypothetical protein